MPVDGWCMVHDADPCPVRDFRTGVAVGVAWRQLNQTSTGTGEAGQPSDWTWHQLLAVASELAPDDDPPRVRDLLAALRW